MALSEERALNPVLSIGTDSRGHRLVFPGDLVTTNNAAFAAASAKVPTAVKPAASLAAGRAIIASAGATLAELAFFGTDAEDETGAYRVTAWNPLELEDRSLLWIPQILLTGGFTLGAGAATALVASGLMADTVTKTVDNTYSSGGVLLRSPANDTPAAVVFDPGGAALLELELTRNNLTAAALGALSRLY